MLAALPDAIFSTFRSHSDRGHGVSDFVCLGLYWTFCKIARLPLAKEEDVSPIPDFGSLHRQR